MLLIHYYTPNLNASKTRIIQTGGDKSEFLDECRSRQYLRHQIFCMSNGHLTILTV